MRMGDPGDLTGDCLICIKSGLLGELRSRSIPLELSELEIPELILILCMLSLELSLL